MTSKRGRRSLKARVKRYLFRVSYRDRKLSEVVCTTNKTEAIDWVLSNVDTQQGLNLGDIPDVEKGLVLLDSRGRGAFQT